MYAFKTLSSLEKVFFDVDLSHYPTTDHHVMFRNQRLSYQIAVAREFEESRPELLSIALKGPLVQYTRVREVVYVPSIYPICPLRHDENYLRKEPGLYPDPLRPLHYDGKLPVPAGQTRAIWLDVELPEEFPAGEYQTSIGFSTKDGTPLQNVSVSIRVLAIDLPKQRLIHTEWFYTDCIAEANHVRAFSEKHWKSIESYMRVAVQNGINMILTPVFTPELDTYIGGERMTTQLVDITMVGKNRYEFDFSKLDRWITLCKRLGVEYYEIPHFFTQWGALHAPKFVARVNGRNKRIFGWETDALGGEYEAFLSQFIPALLDNLKKNGIDRQCFFHVSDEPKLEALEHYKKCRELLTRHLGDEYPIIDALSNVDFYDSGAIKKPIPSIKHLGEFLDRNIDGLWAYYCETFGTKTFTGRQFTMPTARTRILGLQLWLANIEGFLHWGFNFYHNCYSYDFTHPLAETSGESFVPSGDAFLVYPDHNGTALESIRLNALREAIDDMRALDLVASIYGREHVKAIICELCGGDLPDFCTYPKEADFLLDLRTRLAQEAERA